MCMIGRFLQNHVQHWHIHNLNIFTTLVCSEIKAYVRYALICIHQSPVIRALTWNILLRTLCNYSKFRRQTADGRFRPEYVSNSLMYLLFYRPTNLLRLLHPVIFIKSTITASGNLYQKYDMLLNSSFFSHSLVYKLHSSQLKMYPHRRYLTELWI